MPRRALVLAAVLVLAAAVPAAASTTVPAAAWISANRLPLDDSEHWPDLAGIAEAPGDNAFQAETLCRVGAPDKRLVDAVGVDAARARVDKGHDEWSVQQQIVHYPGDPWRMGQTADQLFTSLQNTVANCGSTAPGARVTVTTPRSHCPSIQRGGCSELAAAIALPSTQTSAHVYLATVGSSVTELAVWSTSSPAVGWSAPDDADVFSAMNPQLCTVWEC